MRIIKEITINRELMKWVEYLARKYNLTIDDVIEMALMEYELKHRQSL